MFRSSGVRNVLVTVIAAALSLALAEGAGAQHEPIELTFDRPFLSVVRAPEGEAQSSRGAVGFDIVVVFGSGLTASQQTVFEDAAAAWEDRITGYLPGVAPPGNQLEIAASGVAIDGAGGILGMAGPTFVWSTANFLVPTEGVMQFDTADLAALEMAGTLVDVIEHEMGHVIGIGTLWEDNPKASPAYVAGSGEYTGGGAVAEWNTEYGQMGTVDVELQGGPGTANGHWNEVLGGAGPVGITDSLGRDMSLALMTGWLNPGSHYSSLTHFSLPDLGYTIGPYTEAALFSDGFESGNLSAWSSAVP